MGNPISSDLPGPTWVSPAVDESINDKAGSDRPSVKTNDHAPPTPANSLVHHEKQYLDAPKLDAGLTDPPAAEVVDSDLMSMISMLQMLFMDLLREQRLAGADNALKQRELFLANAQAQFDTAIKAAEEKFNSDITSAVTNVISGALQVGGGVLSGYKMGDPAKQHRAQLDDMKKIGALETKVSKHKMEADSIAEAKSNIAVRRADLEGELAGGPVDRLEIKNRRAALESEINDANASIAKAKKDKADLAVQAESVDQKMDRQAKRIDEIKGKLAGLDSPDDQLLSPAGINRRLRDDYQSQLTDAAASKQRLELEAQQINAKQKDCDQDIQANESKVSSHRKTLQELDDQDARLMELQHLKSVDAKLDVESARLSPQRTRDENDLHQMERSHQEMAQHHRETQDAWSNRSRLFGSAGSLITSVGQTAAAQDSKDAAIENARVQFMSQANEILQMIMSQSQSFSEEARDGVNQIRNSISTIAQSMQGANSAIARNMA